MLSPPPRDLLLQEAHPGLDEPISRYNSANSTQMESRFLWDFSATWQDTNSRYRVTAFVKNILNEYKRIGANSVAGLWNMTIYGRPRTYGLEVAYHF